VKKMGGLGGMLGMLPGIGKLQKQLAGAQVDDSIVVRQTAIIGSMTRAERRNVKLLNASRRRRIAAGSGTTVQEVNRLIKQFHDMQTMMKRVRKMGDRGMLGGRGLPPGMLPPGLTPPR
jgi:signal recognition particle subunit SRP54